MQLFVYLHKQRVDLLEVRHENAASCAPPSPWPDDVAAPVERIRCESWIGLSEAVNELVRAGLVTHDKPPTPFRQKSHDLGRGIHFDNIADPLEILDALSSR